jgi:hypothetical protein
LRMEKGGFHYSEKGVIGKVFEVVFRFNYVENVIELARVLRVYCSLV